MNTLEILKREANLATDFKFMATIDKCESVAEIEFILKLDGKTFEKMSDGYVGKTHNAVRHIRPHWYDVAR